MMPLHPLCFESPTGRILVFGPGHVTSDVEIVTENDIPGRSFLGVEKILAQNPHDSPEHTKRSKAPPCHASSKEQWKAYKDFLKELVALYEVVSSRFRRGLATLEEFPAYCYPPRQLFRREGPLLLFDAAAMTA